jgi:hypothetical protein
MKPYFILVIGYWLLGIGYWVLVIGTLRYPIGACAVQYPLSVFLLLNQFQDIVNLAESVFH